MNLNGRCCFHGFAGRLKSFFRAARGRILESKPEGKAIASGRISSRVDGFPLHEPEIFHAINRAKRIRQASLFISTSTI
jgi:hypothetical protein